MANWQTIFDEPFDTLSPRWVNNTSSGGTATRPTVADSIMTTLSYTVLEHADNVLYDPQSLYRFQIRAAQGTSSGAVPRLYLGVAGILADGTTHCNVNGADSVLTQHYFAAKARTTAPGDYQTYTGYFMGRSSSPTGNEAPNLAVPGPMHTNAVYFRPILGLGYNNTTNAISAVDWIKISQVVAAGRRVRLTNASESLITWTQIQSWDTQDRDRTSSVLRIIGRQDPVVLLDDVQYPSSTITFLTLPGEMAEFLLLMNSNQPIGIGSPCPSVNSGWYAVLGMREIRLTNRGDDGRRLHEVQVQEVTAP